MTETTGGSAHKLGYWGLTGIVFGTVIGASIFNLAQTLARNASLGAISLAWLVTGIGIFFLVMTFKRLADACPELKAGIYQYAQRSCGNYWGFNMAWGYWLCVILGNVTYAVMISDTVSSFVPAMRGNAKATFLFGTSLVWVMYFLVSRGIKTASTFNTMLSVVKFACVVLIIVILGISSRIGLFTYDFWGEADFSQLGGIGDQVSSCMLVTIWSFLGIEGAVMMSARAKRRSDVGKATVSGYILDLALYILVSFLAFGVMTRPQLAELPNPSLAYALEVCAGSWAKWFVVAAVIISLTGGFVAWTMVCAQVPCEAAAVGIFPRQFRRLNRHGMPWFGMLVATVTMTLCLLLVVTAENVYVAALNLATLMVLPPYLFCGVYLLQLTFAKDGRRILSGKIAGSRAIAIAETVFCLYIMWSGSLPLLMATSVFYIAGTAFYIIARRQRCVDNYALVGGIFKRGEFFLMLLMSAMAVVSAYMTAVGKIQLDV